MGGPLARADHRGLILFPDNRIESLMTFLSKEREPLRRYLYGILGSALAVLLVYGVIDAEQAAVWGALGASALLVPAVEFARSKVTPVEPYVPQHSAE